MVFELLRLFVKTLIVDDKYSLRDSENLQQATQTQLCKGCFSKFC